MLAFACTATSAASAATLHSGFAADVPRVANLRDLGRAPATLAVSLAVTLNYRHEAELGTLVRLQANRHSPIYRHFLNGRQFDAYFAPSATDYVRTSQALQRAGFRIARTYANRTIIDASAPADVAERYFHTTIDRVAQPNAGIRYANITPAIMPLELHGLVGSVSGLNDLLVARPTIEFASTSARAAQQVRGRILLAQQRATRSRSSKRRGAPVRLRVRRGHGPGRINPLVSNLVLDPGFESGGYTYWPQCGNVSAKVTRGKAHSGKYSEFAGSTRGEIYGDAGLCQAVAIPNGGTLSFWVYQGSSEPDTSYEWQWALLLDANGNIINTFYQTVNNTHGWQQHSYDVSAFAGQTLYLYFGVHGDGWPYTYTYQYVDDVSVTSGNPTPSPSPSSTPRPTPTPTHSASPSPTPKPTPTPSGTPKPTPTPTVTPTPNPSGSPIGGPITGPDGGYGPLAVAGGYDLPVQHGYSGTGHATGVAISGDYQNSDLSTFLSYFGVNRSGPATVRVAVDGGAGFNPSSPDSEESTLDVETIVGNAPGTALYMYLFPDLSSQHIEDGYNRAVSDGIVDVLNSSFGGCETGDTAFDTATNQIAQQGAAKGITFAASSGDSGSAECNGSTGVSAPASGPYFVAVGGTTLSVTSTGGYVSETAWSGSGGGISVEFAEPTYQVGVAGASSNGRNVPDVAFAADPNSGDSFYFAGAWAGPIGGTSWASPIYSALQTEINQRQSNRSGYVDPRIYAAFANNGYNAFHDITSGSNGAYSAHTGFDNVTGIGSAKGYFLSGTE
ncbi:MAG: protease pro-enzyme activation domain-containing protein [Candidatus Baltobacteraceae bacterium]